MFMPAVKINFKRIACPVAFAILPLLVLLLGFQPKPVCAQKTAEKQKLTAEERKRVKALVSEFRSSRTEPAAKETAFTELLSFNEAGVKAIERVIEKMLESKSRSYSKLFGKVAIAVSSEKRIPVDEVAELRGRVLALKADPGLTKEQVLKVGDPAIQRLRELLVVPRTEVLKNERVSEARESLILLGQYQDRLFEKKRALATEAGTEAGVAQISFAERLVREEENTVQLAMPMTNQNQAVLAANQQIFQQIGQEEAICITACNLYRNLLGLNVLQVDVQLCLAGRDHSKDMHTINFFAHDSPVPGKTKPWDRAKNFGTTASLENIFTGRRSGEIANREWFHSPGHHKNMLKENVTRIGIGQHEKYWTELFGR